MVKLLALDIDGTLLNSDGNVLKSTIDTIELAKEKGTIVTISTGRPIQGVTKFIDMLKLKAPIITYNGAMIVDSISGEVMYEQGLKKDDAKQIIDKGLDYNVSLIIWSNNRLYVNRLDDHVNMYKKLSGNPPILIENFDQVIEQGITKIIWIDSVSRIGELLDEIKNEINGSVNYCTSRSNFLEFFDEKVSKANALEKIGLDYNIKKEEMMAIGDGDNDLSMIDYVGIGIAMENATVNVKHVATFVTTSNNDDGIAKAIYKFIL